MLSEQQIADGWLPHNGGPCPVADDVYLTIQLRNGDVGVNVARYVNWKHYGERYDIIAYKPEPKP